MLNFKFLGVILVLFSGAFCTYEVKMTFDNRLKCLQEFYEDLDFIISKISYFKVPVGHIAMELKNKKEGSLSAFYNILYEFYLKADEKRFKKDFFNLKLNLSKSDLEFLYGLYLNLGCFDYESEVSNLNNQKNNLKNIINKAEINKQNNQKTKCTLTMCSFILVIIFFI